MKKILYTLLFIFTAVLTNAQARLGSSADDIRSEFSDRKYNLKSAYNDKGVYTITVELETVTAVYYFNKDMICTLTFIIPDNQGVLNYMVEQYNKSYVIVSSQEWKMYNKNGICNIELVFGENLYFFAWTIEK